MKNNKPQDLMSLLQNEYLKRKDVYDTGFNPTYPQIVDENGISTIDFDNLTEEQKEDLKLDQLFVAENKLRADTFNKFLKISEGYTSELDIPEVASEDDYKIVNDRLNNRPGCIMGDFIKETTKRYDDSLSTTYTFYADIFGEHVELPDDIETKSVEEQLEVLKKLYMDTLLKHGYSQDEILNACYSFAENTFGRKEQEMGR